ALANVGTLFDEPGDPSPLTEEIAILRGYKCVNSIASFLTSGQAIFFGAFLLPLGVSFLSFIAFMLVVRYATWVLCLRRWRAWAVLSGCDLDELQSFAEDVGFLPERGTLVWRLQWPAHVL